jgi:DNA-binding response OmpR family regulator
MTAKATVVLVEDSPTQARAIAGYLEQFNIEVVVCGDGPPGIAATQALRPAAVILDVNLPTMDGYRTARQIRRNPATQDIPLIMLTVMDGTIDLVKGLNHGADHYIPKGPNAAEDLWRTLCAFGVIDWQP